MLGVQWSFVSHCTDAFRTCQTFVLGVQWSFVSHHTDAFRTCQTFVLGVQWSFVSHHTDAFRSGKSARRRPSVHEVTPDMIHVLMTVRVFSEIRLYPECHLRLHQHHQHHLQVRGSSQILLVVLLGCHFLFIRSQNCPERTVCG